MKVLSIIFLFALTISCKGQEKPQADFEVYCNELLYINNFEIKPCTYERTYTKSEIEAGVGIPIITHQEQTDHEETETGLFWYYRFNDDTNTPDDHISISVYDKEGIEFLIKNKNASFRMGARDAIKIGDPLSKIETVFSDKGYEVFEKSPKNETKYIVIYMGHGYLKFRFDESDKLRYIAFSHPGGTT